MNVDKLLVEAGAYFGGDGINYDRFEPRKFAALVLATTPPQRTWVDVRDEEIKILWIQYRAALPRYLCFAKALLARAKEENT